MVNIAEYGNVCHSKRSVTIVKKWTSYGRMANGWKYHKNCGTTQNDQIMIEINAHL